MALSSRARGDVRARLRSAPVGVALATLALAACTLTTSFAGLQGGDGSHDASTSLVDGPTFDSGSDTVAAIDGSEPDAGNDGAIGIVDAAIEACGPNTSSDPLNCGACGHDCLGGTCLAGACQPILLASNQGIPRGLGLVDGKLYWANKQGGTVVTVSADGGAPTTLLTGEISPNDLAVTNDTFILHTGDGAITSASLDGGAVRTIVAPTPTATTTITGRIAVANGIVYYTTSPANSVSRISLDGGGAATLATGQAKPFGLTANASRVFWSADVEGSAAVHAMSPDGTNPVVLAPAQGTIFNLTLASNTLYWGMYTSDGGVVAAPLLDDGGASPSVLASRQNDPFAVVADDSGVYWTVAGVPGGVFACPLAGCGSGPRTLVSGIVQPTYISTDSRAVYFVANTNGGAVFKIAK